ncbi:MAG: MarR family transcriptional regulator [Acidimicrobiales bacterium]
MPTEQTALNIAAQAAEAETAAGRALVDDPGAAEAGGRTLGRTAAWLGKQVEIGLGTVDLSLPQYRVLGLLDERSAVSSDLAERLAVRPPTVTAVVDGLVARGLVERRNVVADRRLVDHVLTKEGRRVLDRADSAVQQRLEDIAECLGEPDQVSAAFSGLATWRRAFLAYRLTKKVQ